MADPEVTADLLDAIEEQCEWPEWDRKARLLPPAVIQRLELTTAPVSGRSYCNRCTSFRTRSRSRSNRHHLTPPGHSSELPPSSSTEHDATSTHARSHPRMQRCYCFAHWCASSSSRCGDGSIFTLLVSRW